MKIIRKQEKLHTTSLPRTDPQITQVTRIRRKATEVGSQEKTDVGGQRAEGEIPGDGWMDFFGIDIMSFKVIE